MPPTTPDAPSGKSLAHPRSAPRLTVWNIQALRGVAALMVLSAHLKFAVAALAPGYAQPPILTSAYGAGGVDLFFIISGYVISLTAGEKHHGPRDFICARIARVVPLYFVITLAFVAAKLVALGGSTTFVSAWNGFLYLPLFDFNGYTPPPLDVGWTLGFEMWFYLVFTLLLNFLKPRQVAIALPALFLAGAVAMTPYHGAWYFPTFMFHPFVLEFSLGCIVCLIQEHLTGWRPIALLAGGVVYFFLFSRNSDNLGWYTAMFGSHGVELGWQRVLLWGVPAALVTAGLVGLERNHGYVLPRALVYVGGFSYSLYLVHRLVESALVRFGTHLGLHQPLLVIAAMVGLSLLLAWLCWLTLEAPLTHWAQRILKTKSRPPSIVSQAGSAGT